MISPVKRRVRASGLAAASALVLTAASVFGLASAAQADYVSPDDLTGETDTNWYANSYAESEEEYVAPGFSECSIVFDQEGGGVGYYFSQGAEPTGIDEVTDLLRGFSVSVPQGGGVLGVLIDRVIAVEELGLADIYLEIPVGVSGINFDAEVEVDDRPALADLSATPTVQEVLNALDATGDEFYVIELTFYSEAASEVQWFAFGSETYWFGTDAEWFLNDRSCGTDPTPEPQPADSTLAPTKPVRVETGL